MMVMSCVEQVHLHLCVETCLCEQIYPSSFRVHSEVLVSIPEAFSWSGSLLPIWPFKSSFPTKITQVLWSVTCGCVIWSAEAQGSPALSVFPICGTKLPLGSHSKHSSRTTAFLSACELKLFLLSEPLLRLFFCFFFDTTRFYLYLCSSKCMIFVVCSVDFGFFCPCLTALWSTHALLIVLDFPAKTFFFFRSALETKVLQW